MRYLFRRWTSPRQRNVEVGWLLNTEQAGFVWEAPRRLTPSGEVKHAKAVNYCPAVLDFQSRIFEVPCPIDLTLTFKFDEKDVPVIVDGSGDRSTIRRKTLGQMLAMVGRKEWRHPRRPIIQISTPYLFVADEPVYLSQMAPFDHFRSPQWPGLVIGGRFSVHDWVRPLLWAFEWHDISKELVLRRGEPWFYVRFEAEDPTRPIRIVEAAMTTQLKEFVQGASGVTNYINRNVVIARNCAVATTGETLSKEGAINSPK